MMESSTAEKEVVQGLTSHMEMCDYFIYFAIYPGNMDVQQVRIDVYAWNTVCPGSSCPFYI